MCEVASFDLLRVDRPPMPTIELTSGSSNQIRTFFTQHTANSLLKQRKSSHRLVDLLQPLPEHYTFEQSTFDLSMFLGSGGRRRQRTFNVRQKKRINMVSNQRHESCNGSDFPRRIFFFRVSLLKQTESCRSKFVHTSQQTCIDMQHVEQSSRFNN